MAPIVALGGIIVATLQDPAFAWTTDALSDLGVRPASRWTFNGALVLGGSLALVYAGGLWQDTLAARQRIVAGLFGLAGVHLAGVGIFVIGHPLHLPAAVGFYGLMTVVFVLDGLGRRQTSTGRLTLGLAGVHVLIWMTWALGLWPGPGLALPEFAGALLVSLWMWLLGPAPTVRTRWETTDS